jgi:hypothetical protein
LTLGMVIAAVVGRMIWPVLPQKLFRDDLLKFFVQLKERVKVPEAADGRTRLPVGPSERQTPNDER